jgi:hypothetical protein
LGVIAKEFLMLMLVKCATLVSSTSEGAVTQ